MESYKIDEPRYHFNLSGEEVGELTNLVSTILNADSNLCRPSLSNKQRALLGEWMQALQPMFEDATSE